MTATAARHVPNFTQIKQKEACIVKTSGFSAQLSWSKASTPFVSHPWWIRPWYDGVAIVYAVLDHVLKSMYLFVTYYPPCALWWKIPRSCGKCTHEIPTWLGGYCSSDGGGRCTSLLCIKGCKAGWRVSNIFRYSTREGAADAVK